MANIRKSFNFRNGVQVDNDNFIVDKNGLVGIGTSIPTEALDLYGNAKFSGLTTSTTLGVAKTANFYGDLNVGSNINIDPTTGDVTATRFVGDASGLTGIFAISTTGWVASGGGLYTFRNVGVNTTNPGYDIQVNDDPETGTGVYIQGGGVRASGVITASSFSGTLSGNATNSSTATQLQTSRNFSITGDVIASSISFNGTNNVQLNASLSNTFNANTSGTITAGQFSGPVSSSTATITQANITNLDVTGIGTFDNLEVIDPAASISVGQQAAGENQSGVISYESSELRISNYDVGGVLVNLHEGTGSGSTTGFLVRYGGQTQFNATYDGRVSINKASPFTDYNLDLDGSQYISENLYVNNNGRVVGVLTVGTGSDEVTFGDGSSLPFPTNQTFNITSGISTFNDIRINDLAVSIGATFNSIGIGTTSAGDYSFRNQSGDNLLLGDLFSGSGLYHTDDGVVGILEDPRTLPGGTTTIPILDYGSFQVKSGAATFVSSQLLIVPEEGVITSGYGGAYGIKPGGNYDTNQYLSMVGINTYFSRSLLDVGAASTSMNSYFIPPSLSQGDIDIVSNLWQASSGFGTATAKKITPGGVVPGAIVHNQTTDTIQVRDTASTFRNLSPVVAFATVDSGSFVSSDGYNLGLTNNLANAIFSFSTPLQSADYTVMVSVGSTTESYTVPEAQKLTTGFRITFSPSNANTQSYTVMILQV